MTKLQARQQRPLKLSMQKGGDMKKITLQIKVFILLILFILPCNAIAAEKFTPAGSKQGPEIFVQMGYY